MHGAEVGYPRYGSGFSVSLSNTDVRDFLSWPWLLVVDGAPGRSRADYGMFAERARQRVKYSANFEHRPQICARKTGQDVEWIDRRTGQSSGQDGEKIDEAHGVGLAK
jgi:hypothetical protein